MGIARKGAMEPEPSQDERYLAVASAYGGALERLARGYEADPEHRRDLLQEIHVGLWRSFARFDGRCSERTWIYRVAHNVATSHVLRARRLRPEQLTSLEAAAEAPAPDDPETEAGERHAVSRLMRLVHSLKPADRQIALLYLEGLDAAAIGEVAGLTSNAAAAKIHRLKAALARQFNERRSA